jgi:hypothetical protein
MNLRKRTQKEIDHDTLVYKDFTGGYEYLPWLIYIRLVYILSSIGIFIFGISCFILTDSSEDVLFQILTGISAIIVSIVINLLLVRSYHLLKRGIQS